MQGSAGIIIAILLLLLVEVAYISTLSRKTRICEYRLREMDERFRVVENIHDWCRATRKASISARKPRKRYIVFRVVSDKKHDRTEIWSIIRRAAVRVYGEPFLSKARLDLAYYDRELKTGILRTTNLYKDHVVGLLGIAGKKEGIVFAPVVSAGSIARAKEHIY